MKKNRRTSKRSNIDQNRNLPKKAKISNAHTSDSTEIHELLENSPVANNIPTKCQDMYGDSCNMEMLAMPSLKDLEKMFEVSDDNGDTNNIMKNDMQCELATSETQTPIISIHPHIITNNFSQTDWDTFDNRSQPIQLDSQSLKVDEESVGSPDSNKTIDYNLSLNSTFSPLPSTSRDSMTISKNDELFHNSLKENIPENKDMLIEVLDINKNTVIESPKDVYNDNSNDEDCVIIENDPEPIVRHKYNDIFDSFRKALKKDSCPQIISPKSYKPCDDDIVSNPNAVCHIASHVESNSTNIVSIEDEIIDVDALISKNQSLIETFEKSQINKKSNSNLVDVSLVADTSPNIPEKQCQHQSVVTSNDNKIHTQKNNQQGSDRPIINEHCNPNPNLHEQIENEVKTFFDRFYGRTSETNAIQSSQSRCLPITVCRRKGKTRRQKNKQPDIIVTSEIRPNNSRNNGNNTPSTPQIMHYSRKNNTIPTSNMSLNFDCLLTQFTPNINTGNEMRRQKNEQDEIVIVSESKPITSKNYNNNPIHANNRDNRNKTQSGGYSPKEKNIQSTSNDQLPKNLGTCPICIDSLFGKTIASTICGHVFCMQCLEKAIKTQRKCPTCRKCIKNNGYHKIFL